jgi:hypothetical protein
MHLFRRTRKLDPKAYDAHRPHPYIDATDAGTAGLATANAGMQSGFSGVANLAVTDRVMRTSGCAVPGCGKAAAEDIHAPADE